MTRNPAIARIVVCDDSPSYAQALTLFLEQDRDLRVVGRCATAEETLALLPSLRPDLVTMDLELPGADGIDAVRWLASHGIPVLVLSAHVARGSERAAAALGAGALEAFPKREISLSEPNSARAIAFRRRVKRLARVRAKTSGFGPARPTAASLDAAERRASIVAICASTGGPAALATVLSALPANFSLPVLVVQHMAEGFLDGLIGWLDSEVALPVRPAVDGAPARPGVWFAPEGAHLVLEKGRRTVFDAESIAGYHRPAADVLFTSAAASVGPGTVSVVLTGMGGDGAEGTGAVRAAGGLTIAQDRDSSTIFGMPRAAAEHGAELILPLQEIGTVLANLRTPSLAR